MLYQLETGFVFLNHLAEVEVGVQLFEYVLFVVGFLSQVIFVCQNSFLQLHLYLLIFMVHFV